MMKKLMGILALAALVGGAQAAVVDFESVSGAAAGTANNGGVIITAGVGGLSWAESIASSLQLYAEPRAITKLGAGVDPYLGTVGEVGGSWIAAINNSGSNISFSGATAFDFTSLFLYGSKANEVVTIAGYNGATQLNTWTTGAGLLTAGTAQTFNFTTEFTGVTKITITSLKGLTGFDNLVIAPAAAVPEASTYAMLLAGLGMIGLMARRRTNT